MRGACSEYPFLFATGEDRRGQRHTVRSIALFGVFFGCGVRIIAGLFYSFRGMNDCFFNSYKKQNVPQHSELNPLIAL